MKTSKNVIFIIFVFLFFNCKKENKSEPQSTNSSNPPAPTIINSWKYTSLYYSNDNGLTWYLDGGPVPADILTFKSDGSYNCPTRDFTRLGQPGSNVADNGSYINTDSLTISSSVSMNILKTKVVKLTETELWLRYACKCYEVRFTKN